ncbi:MAG TPA: formyl transferase, partial [Geminicoccaceae bacterium]|nr:formyl transferase [Geminicoccaceae bacterium]
WRTPSVNAPETVTLLRRLAPGAVAVWGTRVLASDVLQAVPAPFINLHPGLTPAYRGFDAGYRALAQGDPNGCGVTVHLIDEGIDTGPILRQAVVRPSPADTLFTLPLLQLAIGLPLWIEVLADALDGRIEARPADGPSRFWTKPTLGEYLRNGWRRGVW